MPESVRLGVIAGLSPRVRQLTDRAMDNQTATGAAALQYGFVYSPPVADGPTLARVIATIPAADARVIVSGLSPERRAEIGATSLTAWPPGTACP
jgi:tryptophan synthase alpha subunit